MTESVTVSSAVMLAFMATALVWSAARVAGAAGWLRVAHAAVAALMTIGGLAALKGNAAVGLPAGLGLVVVALAVLLGDGTRWRWLAFVQVVAGMLLAAGLPFR